MHGGGEKMHVRKLAFKTHKKGNVATSQRKRNRRLKIQTIPQTYKNGPPSKRGNKPPPSGAKNIENPTLQEFSRGIPQKIAALCVTGLGLGRSFPEGRHL